MDHNRVPTAIGLMISEKAMEKLPKTPTNFTFRLPNKAQGLSFNHIDFGWNPVGHEPEHVYNIPHFDIHFYMISEAEKMDVTPGDNVVPDMSYWPENYVPTDGSVPMMGKHWLNLRSNEAQGKTFTQTLLYGSFQGNFIFYEPMITLDYFKQKTNMEYEIYQPKEFQNPGYYYPTKYSINFNSTKKVYTVVLAGMVLR